MRQIDNAELKVEVPGTGLRRLTIEAATGEVFLVEITDEQAVELASELIQDAPQPAAVHEPVAAEPVDPPEPAPAPAIPASAAP
jgi:hypothetical protein